MIEIYFRSDRKILSKCVKTSDNLIGFSEIEKNVTQPMLSVAVSTSDSSDEESGHHQDLTLESFSVVVG